MEIGKVLKQARQEKGYSFEDVEEATKIRIKYLKALEEENFDTLPGYVYTIAFIKSYAKFLGLDGEELAFKYKQLVNRSKEVNTLEIYKNKKKVKGSRYILYFIPIALLCMCLIFVLTYNIFISDYQGKVPNDEIIENQQEQELPDKTLGKHSNITNDQQGVKNNGENKVEVILDVVSDKCWMKIEVDGREEFVGILYSGDVKKITGHEYVRIRLGNAGVVDVKVNGKDLGFLAPRGAVVEREFRVENL